MVAHRQAPVMASPSQFRGSDAGRAYWRDGDDAVLRVYDEAGTVIETHEHAGDFKEP